MYRNSARWILFSFMAALLLWMMLYSFLVSIVHPRSGYIAAVSPQEYTERFRGFSPEPRDAITVLFMGVEGLRAPPDVYLLARFDPAQGTVALTAIPGNMQVLNEGRPESLAQVYTFGGVQYTRDLLAAELGIGIDRFVRLTPESFVASASVIGSVQFSLPEAITVIQDGVSLELREGLQLLDGRRALQVLRHRYGDGGQRLDVLARLSAEIIEQRRDVVLSAVIDNIFERIINIIDSDISYADYIVRKPAAEYFARLPGPVTHIVAFSGVREEGRIIAADTYIAQVRRYFG